MFFLFMGSVLCVHSTSRTDSDLRELLFLLSSEGINYSTSLSEDSIISLCNAAKKEALGIQDYTTIFKAGQIEVNSHCLKGDLGLAIDKASEMYKEARRLNSSLGIALSIQALGNTYIYTNRYMQADSTFSEAYDVLRTIHDDDAEIRLLIQHIHVCLYTGKSSEMSDYLKRADKLVGRLDSAEKKNYAFILDCYRTLYYLAERDVERAESCLELVLKSDVSERVHNQWDHLLYSFYYLSKNEYEKALLYADSTLN